MDIQLLADTLTIFLRPALPFLLKAGEKASEEAGKKLGTGVWDQAKQIWGKLRPAVDCEPMAKGASLQAADSPDDDDAQAALRLQLRKLLKHDGELAETVSELLEKAKRPATWRVVVHGDGAIAVGPGAVAAGKGGVAVGGDVRGSVALASGAPQSREDDD